ncbi:hypothetical protein PGT21_030563 [Puccinia graminis f. sp. tritici]|uniref:Uncharacterized protein n=2 Tax=Puccinia graminis f. sp. tritici TaxID=56615 RepID=H6QP51_PUCGT|nr:uncharacterized protein PGTG_20764 [Puccinia graminis f. sp. tritici CRL 75-36-700-3]EHS63181.1 hypothetical protein PGTG_20764 [Puccinia graminis f. sp. tritici CRL 75-36-700-3]KAA1118055.1 hypothetical protein PGT21_030563 [Puccinia graminis f. sp. tritici]
MLSRLQAPLEKVFGKKLKCESNGTESAILSVSDGNGFPPTRPTYSEYRVE